MLLMYTYVSQMYMHKWRLCYGIILKQAPLKFHVLQVEAFQCCKECCTDQTSSHEKVTHCMQRCMKPVQETEQLVSSELEHFQVRVCINVN